MSEHTVENDAHDWVAVPKGSGLTDGTPFRFCVRCDREEWRDGIVRPGVTECVTPPDPSEGALTLLCAAAEAWGFLDPPATPRATSANIPAEQARHPLKEPK